MIVIKKSILSLESLNSIFLLDESLLEPYVLKETRTVLRRERRSNPPDLSDYSYKNCQLGISKYKNSSFYFSKRQFQQNKAQRPIILPITSI